MLVEMGFAPEEAETVTVMEGRGCDICNNTGYKGRTALFESSRSPTIRELILAGPVKTSSACPWNRV